MAMLTLKMFFFFPRKVLSSKFWKDGSKLFHIVSSKILATVWSKYDRICYEGDYFKPVTRLKSFLKGSVRILINRHTAGLTDQTWCSWCNYSLASSRATTSCAFPVSRTFWFRRPPSINTVVGGFYVLFIERLSTPAATRRPVVLRDFSRFSINPRTSFIYQTRCSSVHHWNPSSNLARLFCQASHSLHQLIFGLFIDNT